MKNLKKGLSLIIAFVMALGTVGIVAADREFSDLPAGHWAYANVQTLVADGTINGYQDGTFRPDANVTRAEFVKMIGKTDKVFSVAFDDIQGHWAYDYIMYSDMDVEGSKFNPDVAITRNDVINLLWKRAGSPDAVAPSIITNQSTKPGAAAWAYSYGIMNGDDGITMRLSDGVTRAEATALICRSRAIDVNSEKKSFAKTVNPEILKKVFEYLNTYDTEYNPEKTYTNGEIAAIAMRIAHDTEVPKYPVLVTNFSVDRPNSFAFYTSCQYIWGDNRMTEEFYDATANRLDTLALLTFAADFKSDRFYPDIDGNVYADVTTELNNNMKIHVSGAYVSGIRLDNSNNIYPNNAVTEEDVALILLQLDSLAGLSGVRNVTSTKNELIDSSMKTDIANYPANADRYPVILKDIPVEVYNSAFVDGNGAVRSETAKDMYELARVRPEAFLNLLREAGSIMKDMGADVDFVFIPSMIVETDSEYVMKVKVTVNSVQPGKTFDDVIPNMIEGAKPELKAGLSFYATIATGSKISGFDISIDNTTFTSIDYIY